MRDSMRTTGVLSAIFINNGTPYERLVPLHTTLTFLVDNVGDRQSKLVYGRFLKVNTLIVYKFTMIFQLERTCNHRREK